VDERFSHPLLLRRGKSDEDFPLFTWRVHKNDPKTIPR
jgi:hypothetical protein